LALANLEFLEREYNARASISNAADHIAAWSSRSLVVRDRSAHIPDLLYGSTGAEKLDYFPCTKQTTNQAAAPLLVFIHGGYWRSLDKLDFSFIAPAFCANGVNVAIINYALVPSISMAQLSLQIVRALVWLHQRHEPYDFDPNQMVIAGHSAGGHLAALMMAANWTIANPQMPKHPFKAAIALSGLFDLEPLSRTPFLAKDLKLNAASALALSPACMPAPATGKLMLAVGELESSEFKRQSKLLQTRWPKNVFANSIVSQCHHLSICDAFANAQSDLFGQSLALCKQ
jgi:arylformamidase